MRWRWDSRRDEREFAVALRAWARERLPDPAGASVIARRRGAVTLVLAPDARLARRVARAH
jgi:hypothetical protein